MQGDPSLCKSPISLKAMIQTVENDGMGFWVQLGNVAAENLNEQPQTPLPVAQLLSRFELVFSMPTGLPPQRAREHSILLKEGVGPISVRPYRYAQAQKDEIERLVVDMMQAGIIRPSSSPFSSPVLLVKKKDGTFRMCFK